MTDILTSIHGRLVGLDKDEYLTTPVGVKVPALYIGTSGSETQLTATATELNRAADASGRIVSVTTSALSVTEAAHDSKTIVLNKATGSVTVTLPAATGSGTRLRVLVGTTKTSSSYIIKTSSATQFMAGTVVTAKDSTDQVNAWEAASTAGRISLNGSTKGGLKGDWFELEDVASALWIVRGQTQATGTEATPFSSAIA